jgi:methylenetetrahydrofolate reductase (NADPH)
VSSVFRVPVSFEFFPPKTAEGEDKLVQVVDQLSAWSPEFFSVTYGAGGSTQEGTFNAVARIRALGFDAAPHLSCVGATRKNTWAILDGLKAQGVRRIVALRGDLPSGMGGMGELAHASDLVSLIREHSGDWFHVVVAAYPEYHPQAKNPQDDLMHFVHKMHCGADSAVTQYFYNPDAYARFVDAVRAHGVNAPIVPGIMPITNYSRLARFSETCGAEIPRWILLKLASYGNDVESIRAFGEDVVANLCARLIELGAPSVHFYTLNQAEPTLGVLNQLRTSVQG